MKHRILLAGIMGLACAVTGCTSFRFQKAWREAQESERWQGNWKSARRGNGGALRAVVKTEPAAELDVYFEAHWHGFVTAYRVPLHQQTTRKKTELRAVAGQHDLKACLGGGTYTYSGTLSNREFKVHYQSAYDTGDFVLVPAPAK
jgi:hypothetical protein